MGTVINKKNSYQRYAEEICPQCLNKNNNNDVCKITKRIDNTYKCFSFERCMKIECRRCKFQRECEENGR